MPRNPRRNRRNPRQNNRGRNLGEKERIKEIISKAYVLPGHPIAFSATDAVYRFFKHTGVTKNEVKDILRENDAYVLHKEYKRPKIFNPYFIYHRRKLIQADLIDVRNLAQHNDGFHYLLLIIDVFTKRVWVYPTRRKTGEEIAEKLKTWLDSLRTKPKVFSTDAGREFFNPQVRTLLQQNNVDQQLAKGTCKAAVAERANKSIQILLYKYITEKETFRYIDQLKKFETTYNRRPHKALDYMFPLEADLLKNERKIRQIYMRKFQSIKKKKPRLKIGDMVRVKTEVKSIEDARRAYAEQYNGEYFLVEKINTRLPIPMYYLKSMDTDEIIEGGFYENELSLVRGNVFKVEKILARRKRGRRKEVKVRWKYFSERHDSWIPESDLIDFD